MKITRGSTIIFSSIAMLMSACGGGDNKTPLETAGTTQSSDTDSADVTDQAGVPNKRVKTFSADRSQDGTTDVVTTYEYDDMGRVTSIATDDVENGGRVMRYEYQGDVLARKYIDGGTGEVVYTWQNGRLVEKQVTQITGSVFTSNYVYDEGGRLVGYTGIDFVYYSDTCNNDVSINDEDLPVPVFTISYSGDQPIAVQSTDGFHTVSYTYNDMGSLTRKVTTTDCGVREVSEIDKTLTYENGLLMETLTIDRTLDQAGEELSPGESDVWTISRDAVGRITSSVVGGQKYTQAFDQEGLLESVTYSPAGAVELVLPGQVGTYSYENGSCVVSHSVDPVALLTFDAYESQLFTDGPHACGYQFDLEIF